MTQEMTKTKPSEPTNDFETEKVKAQVEVVLESPDDIRDLSVNLQRVTASVERLQARLSTVEEHMDIDEECWQCSDYESDIEELRNQLYDVEEERDKAQAGEHRVIPCELQFLLDSARIINGRRCWCPGRQEGDTHPHNTLCVRLQNLHRFDPARAATLRRSLRP